ncbi:MAG: PTS fructose transporter subunit IIA [Myxococcales bacterium]|nr:PTS fructose transporter subunit IIA [Myxococcales bacterium]|tara:strand:- start:4911 stop:5372 length:462 start_codon:yes stop_codon:yes gene_type:complete
MQITDFLDIRAIEDDLSASSKPGVIRELVGLALKINPDLDPNLLVETLTRREKLQSTGIGNGVAMPHGRTEIVEKIIGCIGRSKAGVDFHSLDGQPTHLFFTLFIPEAAEGLHLKALARLSRLLKSPGFREQLLAAADADAIYQIVVAEDAKL